MPGPATDDPTPEEFRTAMRGVHGHCSLLTVGSGERASGLVVTSGISLSTEPPLVLACVNRSASAHGLFAEYGCFGWSTLGAGHRAVAERFAGKGGIRGAARYEGADWETAVTGAPLLMGAPAAFDCTVEEMIDRATHTILIGRVRAIRCTTGAGALIYAHGRFQELPDG